jgi:hypothetical protein
MARDTTYMPGIGQGIIGSFEQIGKDVVTEAAKVPVDLVGTALESLGSGGQKKSTTTTTPVVSPDGSSPKDTPLDQINTATSEETKRAIARSALEQLAGKSKSGEPSIWDKLKKEETEKKDKQKVAAQQQSMVLNPIKGKAKRGSLYGIKQKSSSEMSKNARQD